ncbi:ATP synthase F1 subunit epsilon [Candidatus Saccharibacteria bacterium]|nr:ATP synthase F1 subunit epsilon [Candidatus Saccharibacteria bacterium]
MLHFQLVSTKGVKFDDDAYEVLIPTKAGTIALFEDHMPLISAGAPGTISIRKKLGDSDGSMEHFAVSGGVIQVDGKSAKFLSDEVTTSEEVNEQEAEAALARAKELVKNASGQVALHEAKQMLHHSSAQLNVAKFKKRHHR